MSASKGLTNEQWMALRKASLNAPTRGDLESMLEIAVDELKWIAGVPQDSILDAPEVWGKVIQGAREALAKIAWDE